MLSEDHDYWAEKMIPFVTLYMNVTKKSCESLYNGGQNGLGRIFVSVNNTTTDPYTRLKHVPNAYQILVYKPRKEKYAPWDQFFHPFPYYVQFETDNIVTNFQTRLRI